MVYDLDKGQRQVHALSTIAHQFPLRMLLLGLTTETNALRSNFPFPLARSFDIFSKPTCRPGSRNLKLTEFGIKT